MLDAIEAVKEKVVLACKVLQKQRVLDGYGHLTARLADGRILSTPHMPPGKVALRDLIIIDADGNKLEGRGRFRPRDKGYRQLRRALLPRHADLRFSDSDPQSPAGRQSRRYARRSQRGAPARPRRHGCVERSRHIAAPRARFGALGANPDPVCPSRPGENTQSGRMPAHGQRARAPQRQPALHRLLYLRSCRLIPRPDLTHEQETSSQFKSLLRKAWPLRPRPIVPQRLRRTYFRQTASA